MSTPELYKEIDRLNRKVCALDKMASNLLESCAKVADERDRLAAQNAELGANIASLFDAIKHGDDDHQAWLKHAIDSHFAAAIAKAEVTK